MKNKVVIAGFGAGLGVALLFWLALGWGYLAAVLGFGALMLGLVLGVQLCPAPTAARVRTETDDPPAAPGALPAGFGLALLERMPAALIVIAGDGRLSYANPAAVAILPAQATGVHFSAIIRAPSFAEGVAAVMGDRLERTISFTLTRGRERYYEARIARLPTGGGFGDVAQVIVQIEDRSRDRQAIQTRSDFIANASHELRTPLASIIGYIETLQGHGRDDPAAREQFLEIMDRQANRMQRLVNDLMSLSRIEMNAHVRPDTMLDLNRLAQEVFKAMEPLAAQSGVTLALDLVADALPVSVRGDRDQINQVLVNLIDNAIKYSGAGKTVRIAAAGADPAFPRTVGLMVEDDGPGIPREFIPRLTERFFRVNPAQSRDKGGTGLGLAITKHILNRHEGALDIASEPGKGSRFTIRLPVSA